VCTRFLGPLTLDTLGVELVTSGCVFLKRTSPTQRSAPRRISRRRHGGKWLIFQARAEEGSFERDGMVVGTGYDR